MKSYSILSPNDGQLLIRFHDECVKAGMKSDEYWNQRHNPNEDLDIAERHGRLVTWYCLRIYQDRVLCYQSFDCASDYATDPELIHLTPENFDEVLKKVLANLKNYSTYGKRPSNAVVLE